MSLYKLLSTNSTQFICLVLTGVVLLSLLGGTASASTIGVGVSTGRVVLNNKLKPGITYDLPKIAVFNNGDVDSDYEMSVQFNEKQDEYKPAADWVKFSPQKFTLKPGKAKTITMSLRAAPSAKQGEYFAYLEAHPLKKDKSGKAAINIAAATKLSFKVGQANFFQRIFFFLVDVWNRFKVVIIPMLLIIAAAAFITFGKRNLKVEIQRKKPASKTKGKKKPKKAKSDKS